jgi:hypothetical protein
VHVLGNLRYTKGFFGKRNCFENIQRGFDGPHTGAFSIRRHGFTFVIATSACGILKLPFRSEKQDHL